MNTDGPHRLCCVVLADSDESAFCSTAGSVAFADEVITVSPFFSARPPENFSASSFVPNRSDVLPILSAPWVLFLNAGDVVSPPLAAEITAAIVQEGTMAGRSLSITSYFLGRRMGSSDLASHGEVRLMRRDAANAVLSGKKAFLPSAESPPAFESPLEHHGAASLQSLLSAMNDSTSLDVTEGDAQTHGGRSFVTRPLGTFTHLFFGQMGYRDGMHGLFYALFQAMRVLLISAKRWELERACRSGGATPPVTVEMVMNLKRLE